MRDNGPFTRNRGGECGSIVAQRRSVSERIFAREDCVNARKKRWSGVNPCAPCFDERLLTVVGTVRLQGRNTWEYLVAACQAGVRGTPVPSILV